MERLALSQMCPSLSSSSVPSGQGPPLSLQPSSTGQLPESVWTCCPLVGAMEETCRETPHSPVALRLTEYSASTAHAPSAAGRSRLNQVAFHSKVLKVTWAHLCDYLGEWGWEGREATQIQAGLPHALGTGSL